MAKSDISEAMLSGANLTNARLTDAVLRKAVLDGAVMNAADLTRADFSEASLRQAKLMGAVGDYAILRRANLFEARLASRPGTSLVGADLREAELNGADLSGASFASADLRSAKLSRAIMVETDLQDANLSGCHVYGVAVWQPNLERAKQRDLVITPDDQPEITVDNLEVAQFIYLLLHNEKIRGVIDTITSKVVLILGRFTSERKAVLDALREELRRRDYLPVLFDFDKPASRDITETVSLLARMARFVVADITDARSIPQELMVIAPDSHPSRSSHCCRKGPASTACLSTSGDIPGCSKSMSMCPPSN